MTDWQQHISRRFHFTGRFTAANRRFVLLHDIQRMDGAPLRDHMWLPISTFKGLDLRPGDRVTFSAKINRYAELSGPITQPTIEGWKIELTNIRDARRRKSRE